MRRDKEGQPSLADGLSFSVISSAEVLEGRDDLSLHLGVRVLNGSYNNNNFLHCAQLVGSLGVLRGT